MKKRLKIIPVAAASALFAGVSIAYPAPVALSETLREFSPWSMFMNADPVVKTVIIGLCFASLVAWTIFFAKSITLSIARRRLERSMARLANCRALDDAEEALPQSDTMLRGMLAAVRDEMQLSARDAHASAVEQRAASRLAEFARRESRAVRQGMSVLATIGATAPFVGLFGTVWGIMNSFIGISNLQTTNLAVVAPGIAEALLATACGLAAAIPAVVIYNHLARKIRSYGDLVASASGAVARLLSRSFERGETRTGRRAAE